MFAGNWSERLPAAVLSAAGHWDAQHRLPRRRPAPTSADQRQLTIAFSVQLGAGGSSVSRLVGETLRWPVFDHELLQRIADDLHVRVDLLETLDERPQNWLLESITAFAQDKVVSESSYLHRLLETLFSLAAHGECVLVGRGAAHVLPPESTLRVRIVAPWELRVARLCERGLDRRSAERKLSTTDRDRSIFIKEHFDKDVADPQGYDLTLSTEQLTEHDCAAIIVSIAERRRQRDGAPAETVELNA
jgi:cytidylate kinase